MAQPPKRIARDAEGRIASLDGLRAMSIAAVLYSHLGHMRGFPAVAVVSSVDLGNLGVRVFFVISGFLITTLLLEEHDKRGRISLPGFFFRRVFRIFPAFYAFIAAIFALDAFEVIRLQRYDAIAAITYTMNFHRPRAWEVGHLWSLCVEEQFYLVWPALLVLFGVKRTARLALVAIALAPIVRLGVAHLLPAERLGIGETFPTIMDTIATGCLLAAVRPALTASPTYLRFIGTWRFWVFAALAFATFFGPSTQLDWLVGETIRNVAIALLVDRVVRHPETLLGRFLNLKPLVSIGVLSYSLYLWQQPFMNHVPGPLTVDLPFNLLPAVVLALVSYHLIEKPALALRKRLKLG